MSGGHETHLLIFFKSKKPGNPHQVCPELECVVSGWRSVGAVLLTVGSGTSLISTCTNRIYTEVIHLLLCRTQGP